MTIKEGDFCWNELMTSDVAKAKEFYSSLFGWEYQESKSTEVQYTTIRIDNHDRGGMLQISADNRGEEVPPHWLSYIYVENLNAVLEKAVNLGATIKMPVTPAGDCGHFAIIVDPTGAHIAFWQTAIFDK